MILTLLVGLIVVALVYWVITMLPLPDMVKSVATVILVVVVVIYLLQFIGGPKLL